MSLQSNSVNELRYDVTLSANGAMANVRLIAYKIENGEKVEYEEYNRQVQTPDALNDENPAIRNAAAKFFEALQTFINEQNY